MLRISTISVAKDTATLHLEGHLVGAWVTELRETCEHLLAEGRRVTLDLGDVSFIERPGLDLLASFSRRSVAFVHCSPFQEEQLRRAVETSSETANSHEPA
jgi:anti-anti-sigma regulatory factor